MINKLTIPLMLAFGKLFGQSTIVTDAFLDHVAYIESNFDHSAVGDKGNARGAYQMHNESFYDACKWLGYKHNKVEFWIDVYEDFDSSAHHPMLSRTVAQAYLTMLEERLKKDRIKPTREKLYMAYNMGYAGAKAYSFNRHHVALDRKRHSILARAAYILSR